MYVWCHGTVDPDRWDMAKAKNTIFFCGECGYESTKWMGQCPACKAWNSFKEEVIPSLSFGGTAKKKGFGSENTVISITDVTAGDVSRISSGFEELDRVLGGGIVPGSLILLGGDPGIGKSTLLLQVFHKLSSAGNEVLYVSGEESGSQIKIRADRIGEFDEKMKLFCETSLPDVEEAVRRSNPSCVVIDSIQTMYDPQIASAPGSVSQIRQVTGVFMRLAKETNIPVFIVGHVTKEGNVAGPRILEHMVDTVLYFEGDRFASYRIIRAVKNRFGSTNEIGIFEMDNVGLREVKNPSEYMLSGRKDDTSGSCITCSLEGTRPILLEIQALVATTAFGNPRRTSAGTDNNRLNLLLAVLEKRTKLSLSDKDTYINVAGGLKVSEPAIDLGVVAAIASSAGDFVIEPKTVCFGEVGLSGEVRGVTQAQRRITEAVNLGFTRIVYPYANKNAEIKESGAEFIAVSDINEALRAVSRKG